jgi:hypothetical protein
MNEDTTTQERWDSLFDLNDPKDTWLQRRWKHFYYDYAFWLSVPTMLRAFVVWQFSISRPLQTLRVQRHTLEAARRRKSKGLRWISRYLYRIYLDEMMGDELEEEGEKE